jgi:cobalamin synthase
MNIAIFCGLLALALFVTAAWLLKWEPTNDWKLAWRKWSTWLAAGNALLWSQLTSNTGQLFGFIGQVPQRYQATATVIVFIIAWIAPVIAVHVKQQSLPKEANG